MEGLVIKTKKSGRTDGQIKVLTSWQHTEEVTVAFKRLMALLLRQKIEPKGKEEGK